MIERPLQLCPIDFSSASLGALRVAVAIAERFDTRLIMLTVDDPLLAEVADTKMGSGWGRPQLAHQALEAELGIGLLLPCNVCVWEDDSGGSVVSIARPDAMFDIVENDALQPVAKEADRRLRLALDQATRK